VDGARDRGRRRGGEPDPVVDLQLGDVVVDAAGVGVPPRWQVAHLPDAQPEEVGGRRALGRGEGVGRPPAPLARRRELCVGELVAALAQQLDEVLLAAGGAGGPGRGRLAARQDGRGRLARGEHRRHPATDGLHLGDGLGGLDQGGGGARRARPEGPRRGVDEDAVGPAVAAGRGGGRREGWQRLPPAAQQPGQHRRRGARMHPPG
jgi:hypothetical protein